MSHRTNQRPGPCATCKSAVAADAGTLLGPPWKVVCQACLPFPSLAATPIRITLTGERIHVEPVGRLGNERWSSYKAVIDRHGVRSRKVGTVWQNYGDVGVAGDLIKALSDAGFALEVGEDVRSAVAAAGAVATVDVEAASERLVAVDAELARRGKALYSYQRDGVGWLAARTAALLGDDMGLGKTIQTLAAAPAGAPILVISPAIAKGVWAREAAAWRPDLRVTMVSGRGKFRWPTTNEMLIINFDILPATDVKVPRDQQPGDKCASCERLATDHSSLDASWGRCKTFVREKDDTFKLEPAEFLKGCPAGLVVIIDEAHSCKNPKAQRTVRVTALAQAARDSGGRSWLLTATPLLNSPPELWTVLKVGGLHKDAFANNWGGFARGMGGVLDTITVHGGKQQKVWKWGGTPTPMIAGALKRVMLRRMKADVLGQLPPKTYKQVDVELADRELQHQMDMAWAAIEDELDEVIDGKAPTSIPFSEISALRARIATAKIPALLELVEEYEDAEEPVVVFSAHRAPVEELGKRDGWAMILGGTLPAERTRIENDFQAGKLKGIACTIKAGGVAITLTRAAQEIFVDKEWTPALNAQAEDRCYRIGQERPVMVTELVAAHPLDQQVAKLLGEKQALIGASVEKARMGAGEVKANAAQVAASALASLDGQADKIRAAQLAAAERDATLAALLVRLAADDAAALAREAAEALPLTREQRFERTVERAARKQRELDGAAAPRAARTAIEEWAAAGIQILAAMDADFAMEDNGEGFSKDCVGIGHALARALGADYGLTDRAWDVCVAVCIRFRGQIGAPPVAQEEQAA